MAVLIGVGMVAVIVVFNVLDVLIGLARSLLQVVHWMIRLIALDPFEYVLLVCVVILILAYLAGM